MIIVKPLKKNLVKTLDNKDNIFKLKTLFQGPKTRSLNPIHV